MEALGILLLDAIVDGGGAVSARGFVEYGGECCAGVFDVKIEVPGKEGFVNQESATEVGFAVDGDIGARLDVLRQELGQDDLLGEKFGSDGQVQLGGFAAGGGKTRKAEETERDAAHVRPRGPWK